LTEIVQQCDGDTGSTALMIGKENVTMAEHADVVYVGRECNTVAKVFFAIISYKIVLPYHKHYKCTEMWKGVLQPKWVQISLCKK